MRLMPYFSPLLGFLRMALLGVGILILIFLLSASLFRSPPETDEREVGRCHEGEALG